ncbi:MAG: hypothetical protein H0Z33_09350 [Bacillaceae bacterium]|nr:hypothetical protein [Bacillaceae bacterium]
MREVLSGRDFEERNLVESMLTAEEIMEIARKLDVKVHDLIRTNDPVYKERKDELKEMDEETLARLMSEVPGLIKRPLLKIDDQYVVGVDEEKIDEILG